MGEGSKKEGEQSQASGAAWVGIKFLWRIAEHPNALSEELLSYRIANDAEDGKALHHVPHTAPVHP